jgi:16S rRNA (cytidine1402-2'-O)-methyltransferase
VEGAETEQEGLSSEVNRLLLLLEELPLKQAVQLAVKITGANKNELYQRVLELKDVQGK